METAAAVVAEYRVQRVAEVQGAVPHAHSKSYHLATCTQRTRRGTSYRAAVGTQGNHHATHGVAQAVSPVLRPFRSGIHALHPVRCLSVAPASTPIVAYDALDPICPRMRFLSDSGMAPLSSAMASTTGSTSSGLKRP